MNRNISTVMLLGMTVLLAACGSRGEIMPPVGQNMAPPGYGEPRPPTGDELLTPSTQALPDRNDELLRRSEKRQEDKFDLPPPG